MLVMPLQALAAKLVADRVTNGASLGSVCPVHPELLRDTGGVLVDQPSRFPEVLGMAQHAEEVLLPHSTYSRDLVLGSHHRPPAAVRVDAPTLPVVRLFDDPDLVVLRRLDVRLFGDRALGERAPVRGQRAQHDRPLPQHRPRRRDRFTGVVEDPPLQLLAGSGPVGAPRHCRRRAS